MCVCMRACVRACMYAHVNVCVNLALGTCSNMLMTYTTLECSVYSVHAIYVLYSAVNV